MVQISDVDQRNSSSSSTITNTKTNTNTMATIKSKRPIAWYRFVPRKSTLFALLVCSLVFMVAFRNEMGMKIEITTTATTKEVKTTNRIRFTQGWSTGHCGTRFLTDLLTTPSVSAGYMAWNEHELPFMKKKSKDDPGLSVSDLSLNNFRAMMALKNKRNFQRFDIAKTNGGDVDNGKYGGTRVKKWNTDGDTSALRAYLREERVPALYSVYERYNNGRSSETLNHFIKVGHSSVFFDLSDYYEVLSSATLEHSETGENGETVTTTTTIDVDFVRIKRNRIDVANSFRVTEKGPVEYSSLPHGMVTNPSMETALLKFSSLGGPVPEETWWNWTIFQRWLWFSDEVEARWRVFLEQHPEVSHYELAYTSSNSNTSSTSSPTLTPSSIDDLALNFLEIGLSLSPYMKRIPKQSHLPKREKTDLVLTREEMERQSIEYSRQAPWCLQYEGNKNKEKKTTYEYSRLDCGVLA
jgi:hypothetical protein